MISTQMQRLWKMIIFSRIIKISQEETVTLKEYKAIQKENQRLKIENEILKKATDIFAKEQ
ncbi:MAG: hypothetical protein RR139_05895 [Lachnospiraceae bacterium]